MRCRQRCSPPPARPQGRRVLRDGGLHSGGDEQGESLAARLAGIDLAGALDPVGQLRGADERGREHDLAGEQAMGSSSGSQPRVVTHGVDEGFPPVAAMHSPAGQLSCIHLSRGSDRRNNGQD